MITYFIQFNSEKIEYKIVNETEILVFQLFSVV